MGQYVFWPISFKIANYINKQLKYFFFFFFSSKKKKKKTFMTFSNQNLKYPKT